MRIREHSGGLSESMERVEEIQPTLDSLIHYIKSKLDDFPGTRALVTPERVHVQWYIRDERIGWDTYIVTIDGYGVFGYTDGPLEG